MTSIDTKQQKSDYINDKNDEPLQDQMTEEVQEEFINLRDYDNNQNPEVSQTIEKNKQNNEEDNEDHNNNISDPFNLNEDIKNLIQKQQDQKKTIMFQLSDSRQGINKKDEKQQNIEINQKKQFIITVRKGLIRKNNSYQSKIPQDKGLELSYRMNRLRRQRQLNFEKKMMTKSIEVTSQTQRKTGGILHLRPKNIQLRRITRFASKNPADIQRQKRILEKSQRANQQYYLRKFFHQFIFSIGDEAVERIEQKRSFFSYKFHRTLGKQNSDIKISDFIHQNHQHLNPIRDTRIKISKIQQISISGSRLRSMSISNQHTTTIEKSQNSENQQSQEGKNSKSSSQSQSSSSDAISQTSQEDNSDNQKSSGTSQQKQKEDSSQNKSESNESQKSQNQQRENNSLSQS